MLSTHTPPIEAFEFHGFIRSENVVEDSELIGLGPPAWTDEELLVINNGEKIAPPGSIFHGLLWGQDEAFCAQWVDPIQRQVSEDWNGIGTADGGYRFRSKATNFCGTAGSFAWFGPGFASVSVAPLDSLPVNVASWKREVWQIFVVTTNPSEFFDRMGVTPQVNVQEKAEIWTWTRVMHDTQEESGTLIRRFSDESRSTIVSWQMYRVRPASNGARVWDMRIVPLPEDFTYSLPESPSDLPKSFIGVSDPANVGFTNSTSDVDWEISKVTHTSITSETKLAPVLRVLFGIAIVIVIVIIYFFYTRGAKGATK